LSEAGLATLLVDSYSTRGIEDECDEIHGSRDQSSDAYGAIQYLAGLSAIDPQRVGVLAWGQSPLVGIMELDGVEQFFDRKFSAAVGLYVNCGYFTEGKVYAPTLLVVAGRDDWNKPDRCAASVEAGQQAGAPIFLMEYAGALHAFDNPAMGEETVLEVTNPYKNPPMGATLGYDREAHLDALEKVTDFFLEHLNAR
jgi:dienelactone hydrolase